MVQELRKGSDEALHPPSGGPRRCGDVLAEVQHASRPQDPMSLPQRPRRIGDATQYGCTHDDIDTGIVERDGLGGGGQEPRTGPSFHSAA